MHPLLAVALHSVQAFQVPADTVPTLKRRRRETGTPVKIDPAQRERITLEALSGGGFCAFRDIAAFTGLRSGAQRRTLERLVEQGRVEAGGWCVDHAPKDRIKDRVYRAAGRRVFDGQVDLSGVVAGRTA